MNPDVLSTAKTDLVLTYASQVLGSKSDISGSGEVEAIDKVFTDNKVRFRLERKPM